MSDLLWPGDHRAGDLFTSTAVVRSMAEVEEAWLGVLVAEGLAPIAAAPPTGTVTAAAAGVDVDGLARASESGGNPVIPLVARLRDAVSADWPEAARWLHRGLTSQDVVDTALALQGAAALDRVRASLRRQTGQLADLARTHRDTPMLARTLTQPAVPTTFGLRVAQWLTGVLDAAERLDAVDLPVQVGGAAGTRAALVELAAGHPDPLAAAARCADALAERLGLAAADPWHTARSRTTRLGDALTSCHDAWGRLAGDVLVQARGEVGELREGAGGTSSTMPGKQNPVLAVLVRRAALAAPGTAATLHLAATEAVEERPPGAWHLEWAALRDLARRAVVAGEQVCDLLAGLEVDNARMAAHLGEHREAAGAEQRSMSALTGRDPRPTYDGAAGPLVDAVLARAETAQEAPR